MKLIQYKESIPVFWKFSPTHPKLYGLGSCMDETKLKKNAVQHLPVSAWASNSNLMASNSEFSRSSLDSHDAKHWLIKSLALPKLKLVLEVAILPNLTMPCKFESEGSLM